MVVIGCQPGGDITGCTGRLAEAPARGRRSAIAASARARAKLLKPVTIRIPAGQTRKVRLKLTRAGLAQLKRKRKLTIQIAIEVRAGATRHRVHQAAGRVPHGPPPGLGRGQPWTSMSNRNDCSSPPALILMRIVSG